ncbi:MAG: CopG family transcriptional regulator [Acidobacteria bacterium]|nr:CopG family transcriptional regulator [Acidobacteriota bacterium]
MRTTLNLDDDILHIAKQLAQQRGSTTGQVLSELARQALDPKTPRRMRNGVMVFTPKPGAKKPHLALVNQLRDEE